MNRLRTGRNGTKCYIIMNWDLTVLLEWILYCASDPGFPDAIVDANFPKGPDRLTPHKNCMKAGKQQLAAHYQCY